MRHAIVRWVGTLLFFFAALGVANAAMAETQLDQSARIDLWPHVTVLTETSGALTPEAANAMAARFTPPAGAYASLGMAKEVVWLRVPLRVAEGGAGEWVLDIDYSLLRHVDVYIVVTGRIVQHASL